MTNEINLTIEKDISGLERSARQKRDEQNRFGNRVEEFKTYTRSHLQHYFRHKYRLFSLKQLKRRAPELLAMYLDPADTNKTRIIDNNIGSIESDITYARDNIREYRSREREAQNTLDRVTHELSELQQRIALARLEPEKTITLNRAEIKETLLRNAQIDNVSVQHRNDRQQLKITVSLPTLAMKPSAIDLEETTAERLLEYYPELFAELLGRQEDEITAEDVINDGLTRIPLPEMAVTLTINTDPRNFGEWHVSCDTSLYLCAYSGEFIPHPHWISRNNPCYGDFASTLTEAVGDLDFESFFTFFIKFLQQYDPNDVAGSKFYMWAHAFYRRPDNWSRASSRYASDSDYRRNVASDEFNYNKVWDDEFPKLQRVEPNNEGVTPVVPPPQPERHEDEMNTTAAS